MIFRGFCSIFKYWRNIGPATRSSCPFRESEVVSSGLQRFAMVLMTAARPCVAPLMPRGAAGPLKSDEIGLQILRNQALLDEFS